MELEQRYFLTIILFIMVIGSFILMMLAIKNSGKRKATSLVNLKPEKKKDYGDYLKEAMEQPDFKDSQLCKSMFPKNPIDVNTLKFQNQQSKDLPKCKGDFFKEDWVALAGLNNENEEWADSLGLSNNQKRLDAGLLEIQNQHFQELLESQQKLINAYEKIIEETDKVILEYKKIHT